MRDDDEADELEFLAFQQRSAGAPAPDKVKTRARKTAAATGEKKKSATTRKKKAQ